MFYEACDKIGLLVIQDMPSLPPPAQPNAREAAEFQRQLEIMVNEHKSYPSIYSWVIFNEGWGQLDDAAPEGPLTLIVRDLDPSRLINSVSGWDDHGYGDFFVGTPGTAQAGQTNPLQGYAQLPRRTMRHS